MPTIHEVLEVQRVSDDLYRGRALHTSMQRTFGGQVACQAMVAAVRTVPDVMQVHSLHGYFLRPGQPHLPADFHVDRVRDGRSFTTRRVTAVQDGEAIFTMSASFHIEEDGPTHQDPMPDVPAPEDLARIGRPDPLQHVFATEWPEWDLRPVDEPARPGRPQPPRQRYWLRYRETLPDDPLVHVCAMTYLSDMALLGAAGLPHPDEPIVWASLDHAVWFLRPFRVDAWLLYDQTSPSAGRGRALAEGRLFDRSGQLVASVVQEGLMRRPR